MPSLFSFPQHYPPPPFQLLSPPSELPWTWAWSFHHRPWWWHFSPHSEKSCLDYHYISHKASPGGFNRHLLNDCQKARRKEGKEEGISAPLYFAFNYILLISKNKKQTQKNWQMKNSNEHHKPQVWILKDSLRKTQAKDKHRPRKMPLQYSSITNFFKILQMKKNVKCLGHNISNGVKFYTLHFMVFSGPFCM